MRPRRRACSVAPKLLPRVYLFASLRYADFLFFFYPLRSPPSSSDREHSQTLIVLCIFFEFSCSRSVDVVSICGACFATENVRVYARIEDKQRT